jgi:probable FeS assembly SUF system protein SufT
MDTATSNWVIVKRDIEVVTIPYGNKMPLLSGAQVRIAQSFGGTYTVVTDMGIMVRVDAADADAIGETSPAPVPQPTIIGGTFDEKAVWDVMRTVYDPEIPVNIVDLGLIYECKAEDVSEGGKRVNIKMTMTAPGCGMGDILKGDVERKVASVSGVQEVHVDIVFEPPWSLDKMSEAARLQLGI